MSLLQNPVTSLDQIDWYLSNKTSEKFPGAFTKAAGNLARQTLEQILFILAFYSGVPAKEYLRSDLKLKVAQQILDALAKKEPQTGKTYLHLARHRNARIKKFAWPLRTLRKWKDKFNETSHFRNPAARALTNAKDIQQFASMLRPLIDKLDSYLIVAAANELLTNGVVRAEFDDDGTPGVTVTHVIRAKNLSMKDGKVVISSPRFTFTVLSDKEEKPLRKRKTVYILQHSAGMALRGRFVSEEGEPINPANLQSVLAALTRTPKGMQEVTRRFQRLGYKLQILQGRGAQLTLPV